MRVGTSGYSYPHWKSFYSGAPSLPKYAAVFDTVELNNTFYRFPTTLIIKEWVRQVPKGFLFAVKAPLIITHRARPLLRKFLEVIRAFGKHLGPLLFQFPPNFSRNPENEKRITKLVKICRGGHRYHVALEFRHPSWDDITLPRAAARVVAITPSTTFAEIEKMLAGAGAFIYIRFHPGAIYKRKLRRIYTLLSGSKKEIYIYFNNDEGTNAIADSKFFTRLLKN